jgi:hypothetical protein
MFEFGWVVNKCQKKAMARNERAADGSRWSRYLVSALARFFRSLPAAALKTTQPARFQKPSLLSSKMARQRIPMRTPVNARPIPT